MMWTFQKLFVLIWFSFFSELFFLFYECNLFLFIWKSIGFALVWPPDAKNWLIGKDPDAGKDWRQEEKEMTEDEMIGWHHWLDGQEFEQALWVGAGQGSLACYSP